MMKREPAKIQIVGQCGSGKSTLAHIIRTALEQHGISTDVRDDEDISEKYSPRISSLEGKTVIIETIQTPRKSCV